MKKKVLFLCTGNSSRSQMAEGLLRDLGGGRCEVFSAGSDPAGSVNRYAIEVMKEIGVDISGQTSKSLEIYLDREFDYVITLCGNAQKTCPMFPGGGARWHWDISDPGSVEGGDEAKRASFRRTRDILKDRILETLLTGHA